MKPSSYITFRLGREHFGLPVKHVREVLDYEEITPLPLCPAYVRGVLKVRDEAVPVIDLRTRFGMPTADSSLQTRIIIMEFPLEGRVCIVGGLADAVQAVIELEEAQISPSPAVGSQWKAGLIEGVTQHEGAFVLLLDITSLFSGDELRTISTNKPKVELPPS